MGEFDQRYIFYYDDWCSYYNDCGFYKNPSIDHNGKATYYHYNDPYYQRRYDPYQDPYYDPYFTPSYDLYYNHTPNFVPRYDPYGYDINDVHELHGKFEFEANDTITQMNELIAASKYLANI